MKFCTVNAAYYVHKSKTKLTASIQQGRRDRQTETETERQIERQTDRQRQTENRDRERLRERETEISGKTHKG